jgi:metallo-beta-lactamase family protein
LIDCGLFQGLKELRQRNWSPPPFDPKSLSLVLLTHAHLDHSGYLPVLYRNGYDGRILGTPATRDLCGIVLPDSGHLQEEDARFANKMGFSRHAPALPLYTQEDGEKVVERIDAIGFDEPREIAPGITATWRAAGHILGAAMIEVRLRQGTGEKVILFSGDLGRPNQPIVPEPAPLIPCDHLLLESTYGNRDHETTDPKVHLAAIVNETVRRGGTVLIPAFAIGRTQHLLYLFREMRQEGTIPKDVPIWIDSPMAIRASNIQIRHPEATDGIGGMGLNDVKVATTVEESKALNNVAYPAIIISASGMCEGGRILHHLAFRLGDHRSIVVLVGFQAAGTRGRALQDGKPFIKLHGREIPVRARIEMLGGLSAHADRGEIVSWLKAGGVRPGRVHLVHGEPDARDALAATISSTLGFDVHRPNQLEKIEL